MFSSEQIASLGADLDRKHVATRAQAGRQLSYIEGWHAIAEANRIFGFDGWQSETVALSLATTGERQSNGRTLQTCTYTARCRITVFAAERAIVREGVGAGHGMDQDAGQAHEKAIKEAETDARKRALMTFGNQFGLALYDKTQANVSDATQEDLPRRGGDKVPAQPAPAAPARQIAPVPVDAERTAPAAPQHPTAKRDASRHLASTLIGKADLTYTGLVGGVGNIPLLRKQFIAWETAARQQKPQITAVDWSSVQKVREKVIGALKEIDEALERKAAKADAIKAPSAKTEDVIDPETGELGEAA